MATFNHLNIRQNKFQKIRVVCYKFCKIVTHRSNTVLFMHACKDNKTAKTYTKMMPTNCRTVVPLRQLEEAGMGEEQALAVALNFFLKEHQSLS